MALFDDVFNRTTLYDMLFFNVKSVLEHPTVEDLEAHNLPMFNRWNYISKTKYNCPVVDMETIKGYLTTDDMDAQSDLQNRVYQDHAVYYPEFCRVIAISYASVYTENGELKRELKKLAHQDENIVIQNLMDVFYQLSSEAVKSTPQFFRPLCGHNIIGFDIPLLIKRHILHNKDLANRKQIPLILKRCLSVKPWESGVVDTSNVWKFNGYDNTPLMLVADFLGLKKSYDVLPLNELSRYYWDNIEERPKETLDYIALQSATQTNLSILLMNELRQY